MKIVDIIKDIPGVRLVAQSSGLIVAEVSRNDLAIVATSLVDIYKLPLSLLFGTDDRSASDSYGVHVVFSNDSEHERLMLSARVPSDDAWYPSITATVMAAHWYERYLCDMFGIEPKGHPDPRRLVHHENVPENTFPLRKDFAWNTRMDHAQIPYPMHHVEGEGVFEIPVGPIHAGIIEPGHFRFNVVGERIVTLEGKLFFTHKGVEKLLEGKTVEAGLPFIERLSGDMAASNALAYAQAIESIARCEVPKRAKAIRSLLCELERATMHIHDLGNIGGMGTGYSFVAANCFRIKEELMRLSDRLLGNRFWRGNIIPGGAKNDIGGDQLKDIVSTIKNAYSETRKIINLALQSEGFLERLQTTGVLPREAAIAFGALGLPARASGVNRDVRRDYPYAAYEDLQLPVPIKSTCDVFGRYVLRLFELENTTIFIEKLVGMIPSGACSAKIVINDGFGIGTVESWRGEVMCVIRLKNGVIDRCFPRDPSFCNWPLFGLIGPGNIVPDFPLCNKSLNLSYSGTDM